MNYEKLTPEDQQAMLEARLVALEREHFDNAMSAANTKAVGDADAEEQFTKNMDDIDKVYATVKAEKAKLAK